MMYEYEQARLSKRLRIDYLLCAITHDFGDHVNSFVRCVQSVAIDRTVD